MACAISGATATNGVVAESLRRMVTLPPLQPARQFRLAGRYGLVFCRNVLIYFDRATQAGRAGAHRRDHGAGRRAVAGRSTKQPAAQALRRMRRRARDLRQGSRAALVARDLGKRPPAQPFQHPDRRAFRLGHLRDIQMEGLLQREFAAQRGMQHLVGEDQPAGARRKVDRLLRAVLSGNPRPAWPRHAATASARHTGCAGRG